MAAQINSPVILTASPDDIAVDRDPGTSYSDTLTLVGTATPNSTITVYDGSTQLGTATTNSSGVWSYETPSLTDGTHSFTATATLAGTTSAASSALVQTVTGAISNFSPLTDQWSAPITVGGMPYYVENANINGNAPWAIKQIDSHTLRFQLQPNDVWADNDSHRSEISGGTVFSPTSTINLSYQFTVQPGFNDTSNNLAWQILGQFHGDDNNATYQSIQGGSPPFAFHLTGANGVGEGDYLAIQAFYALPGQTSWTAATLPGDQLNGYLWVSPTPIVRGQPIDVQLEANFQNNSNGFLEVWINGQQVVDYHGALGYGGGVYWKEGIYEGWSSNQPITVDYSNTVITTAPGAPLILGDVVNGNQVLLNGTAQANSTVTIFDGSTKLGTVATSSNGSWFYETGALSIGSHNLTATATDSAGNTSAASAAASATVASFTGPIITGVATSAQTGETVVGTKITFTVKMSSAVSVTGTPTLSLNDGGTAVYSGGSGSNSLTFTYTVGASDNSVKGLAITGANLPNGAAINDASGNAAILTGALVQFPGVTINAQPVSTPVFGDPVDNGNGTFTFTGTAGANTTVYFSTSYGTALGSAKVDASGHWTFTTPTFAPNTWNSIQAYDVNALGDVSAIGHENGVGFGNSSNTPPSPTITGNALVNNAVTLYGTVAAGFSITTVSIFDGTTQLGTATVNSDNTWSFTTKALANGVHSLSAKATSSSGTSAISVPDPISIGALPTAGAPAPSAVASLVASGSGITAGAGDLGVGSVVTLTVNLSTAATVNGGTPTLALNDGGVATYIGGSGTNALTFSYTVAAGQNTSDLAVTAVNLNSASVKDGNGNAVDLSGAVTNPAGTLQIDTTAPTVSSLAASGKGITAGSGTIGTGTVVTLTMTMSEAVTVAGGTPTLTLNNGGTATYSGGSGSNALTFSYTVAAGQDTSDLAVTALNLNSSSIKDGAGNAANLAGAVASPTGTLQIDTTAPAVASVVTSGSGITAGSGLLGVGSVVTLTINLSEAVTVSGGTPTLTLNDGGTATYSGGSGTKALTFSYTVGAGQSTSDLAVTALNLNSATVKDSAGNAANLVNAVTNPAGTLQIETTPPLITSVASAASANSVVLTLSFDEAVTVTGTPTLTLSNGGTATYTGGSGTTALKFKYVTTNPATSLVITQVNLANGASIRDAAGNAASLTGNFLANPGVPPPASSGSQSDTTPPTVSSVVASGNGITAGSGTLPVGSTVTLTVNLSEAVTVAGGTPTLTLNDGGTATYTGGSGSKALTFSYTVAAGQNTSDLAVTRVNLNSATVKDGAGNSANLGGAVTNPSGTLKIDTTVHLTQVGNSYYLDNSAGSGPSLKLDGSDYQFSWFAPIAAVRTATGYEVALKENGQSQYMICTTDANGNWTANLTPIVSGWSSTLQPYEGVFHADLNGDGVIALSGTGTTVRSGSLVIGNGASVEIPGAYSGSISFAGATGTLIIDNSAKFSGSFSGSLASGDRIDLTDITAGASASLSYAGNSSGGTLTVSDGTHTAKLGVVGNYSLANFTASSDGKGGTIIVDPPVADQSSVRPSPSAASDTWLASIDQRLALWSQQIASAFPSSGIDSGGRSTIGVGDVGAHSIQPLARPLVGQTTQHSLGS